jgi:hypothetical protein
MLMHIRVDVRLVIRLGPAKIVGAENVGLSPALAAVAALGAIPTE